MLYHCTSPDSFLFHTYTIQSQSQFNLNKIYFSCSNQIYADSHNRLSCLERLLRQFIDHCSVLLLYIFLLLLSVGALTHKIHILMHISCSSLISSIWTSGQNVLKLHSYPLPNGHKKRASMFQSHKCSNAVVYNNM